MGILDAFKSGGFAGVGGEIGRMLGYGKQITDLTTEQRKQSLSDIAVIKGQPATQSSGLDWYSKLLITGGLVILGAVVISKSMK